jgi:hypothetical protein
MSVETKIEITWFEKADKTTLHGKSNILRALNKLAVILQRILSSNHKSLEIPK